MTAIDLVRGERSLHFAVECLHNGCLPRREYEKYYDAWCWSAVRTSGGALALQDAYERKHGPNALFARIERVKRAIQRLKAGAE